MRWRRYVIIGPFFLFGGFDGFGGFSSAGLVSGDVPVSIGGDCGNGEVCICAIER